MDDDPMTLMRRQMVQIIAAHTLFAQEHIGKELLAGRVMDAMGKVPRHEFVPVEIKPYAYADQPLPIGCDKTISQPFIVALMTDLLDIQPEDRVLEVGTGLGYQAAVLAELAGTVYTVEIVEELGEQADERLGRLGYGNIVRRIGNGYQGWPEHAPFDKIIVAAASELLPAPLIGQLKPGGRMVAPTGLPEAQKLLLVEKSPEGKTTIKEILPVRFALLEEGD